MPHCVELCVLISSEYHPYTSREKLVNTRKPSKLTQAVTFLTWVQKYPIQISPGTPATLTEIFRVVNQSLQANSGMLS
jgi:hypothetical protein